MSTEGDSREQGEHARAGNDPVMADLGVGGSAVRAAAPGDAVAGIAPRYVATPPDLRAASSLLAAAARHGLATVPRGHGSTVGWGRPPRRCDLVVDTTLLTTIEHTAGDLIVQVGAGTPMADLDAALAGAGQRLSVDPVVPGSTVGGVVATGLCGPRRMLHGTVRDLIIGMTTVRADGAIVSSGGRVVKNVAGYDLGKLHTGALGTLGLIASVTFRLHPLPPALRVISAATGDAATAAAWRASVRRSTTAPAAVELDWSAEGPLSLHVLLEGAEGGIEARAAEVAGLLGAADTAAELPPDWGMLPGAPDDTLLKIAVAPGRVTETAASLRTAAEAVGIPVSIRGSAGAGVLYAALPAAADAGTAADTVTGLRHSITEGALTVLRAAPGVLEQGLDLWGEVPGLPLMRAIKDRFDPDRILSPGRFAGGI